MAGVRNESVSALPLKVLKRFMKAVPQTVGVDVFKQVNMVSCHTLPLLEKCYVQYGIFQRFFA